MSATMPGAHAGALTTSLKRALADPWRWRGHEGGCVVYYVPAEMETRHLFYTLRMIWNNFMPAHMRVGRVKLYTFGPTYTPDYLRQAIRRIGAELFSRQNITPAWQREIDEMRRWFDQDPALRELPAARLALAAPGPERAETAGGRADG